MTHASPLHHPRLALAGCLGGSLRDRVGRRKANVPLMNRRNHSASCILQSAICNRFLVAVIAFQIGLTSPALACPFCTAVKPTLAQQVDSANVAFLGECTEVHPITSIPRGDFSVRHPLHGKELLTGLQAVQIKSAQDIKPGTLALILGTGDQETPLEKLDWQCVSLTEVGFAYVARFPDSRSSVEERLKYFARFLESADPLIAEDAFLEFGHAPYDKVMQVGNILSAAKLRDWMVDSNVPAERKGFYGLALGLTANGSGRTANLALLKKLVAADVAPGGDFRAGFDGVLGGFLIADGRRGIDQITERIVTNPKAAEGDVRHRANGLAFLL